MLADLSPPGATLGHPAIERFSCDEDTTVWFDTSEARMHEVNRSLHCPAWSLRDACLSTAVVLGVSVCLVPDAWALQATPTTLSFQAVQGAPVRPVKS